MAFCPLTRPPGRFAASATRSQHRRPKRPLCCPFWGGSTSMLTAISPTALDLFSASAHLPHSASTTRLRVMFALSRHRFDEALGWLQSALFVDPYAPWLHAMLAWTYHLAGRAGEKRRGSGEGACSCFPTMRAHSRTGALILSFNGHAEHGERLARDLVRRTPYFDIATAIHAYTLACSGQRDEAYEHPGTAAMA